MDFWAWQLYAINSNASSDKSCVVSFDSSPRKHSNELFGPLLEDQDTLLSVDFVSCLES